MPIEVEKLAQWQRNVLELAAFIEKQPDTLFTMTDLGRPERGMPGCIAAWGGVLWPETRDAWGTDPRAVAKKLGLAGRGFRMFVFLRNKRGRLYDIRYEEVTKDMAAACLRRYAMTRQVYYDREDKARDSTRRTYAVPEYGFLSRDRIAERPSGAFNATIGANDNLSGKDRGSGDRTPISNWQ